jgi:hypothetical protein
MAERPDEQSLAAWMLCQRENTQSAIPIQISIKQEKLISVLWYTSLMTKTLNKPTKRPAKTYTIGQRGFAKISAVEGIHLSAEMVRDLREFDRKGLSAEERRTYIARKYGKSR